MNNLTATRIVKSVLQRTAEFDTLRYDYVQAPRNFYERLAEDRALAGQWAEPLALELFAAMSPAQRAIHIVMDDDEASVVLMKSTVVARQQATQLRNKVSAAGSLWKAAVHGFWFVPDDPVDLLSQEELVAAFLEDDSLTIVSKSEPEDQGEKPFIHFGTVNGPLMERRKRSPFFTASGPAQTLSRDDLSMHFFGFGETSSGMTTDLSRRNS